MIFALFTAVVVLVWTLAVCAIHARQSLRFKIIGLLAAIALLPVAYAGFAELLSRPKPPALEWRVDLQGAKVIGYQLREGEAIWLWLALPGVAEPRAYVLPWSQRLAEALQRAASTVAEHGGDVTIDGLGDRGGEPVVHARPVPPSPPKATS